MEVKVIRNWVNRIDQSKLSVKTFFKKHSVPFSKSQFYLYKKKLNNDEILVDSRVIGNNRKVSTKIEHFLSGYICANPDTKTKDVRTMLLKRFAIQMSTSGVHKLLTRLNVSCLKGKKIKPRKISYTSCAGFEMIIALAYQLGWEKSISEVISKRIKAVKKSKYWFQNIKDTRGRSKSGKFTAAYNRRKDVRKMRFSSIDSKRDMKNFQSMNIMSIASDTIEKKCLAAMVLPIITCNGAIRSVDAPLGNALKNLCEFNYKQATLNKFFAELKYLHLSEELLKNQVIYWQRIWKENKQTPRSLVACYYVDGNTKALWSKRNVKKNKVTMLGKVMGCLEQVFVHDNYGRPIYFETFPGHAPSGEHVLGLFKKIEKNLLESYDHDLSVNRAIVLDGASNSVKTLRAFASQDKYHYITSLDDNQWNQRKILREGKHQRYQYGDATLKECEIELTDSKDKGFLIVSRAIKIDWDYGKTTVLLTSLKKTIISPSQVVKSYFERWPCQELGFRGMKAGASLNKVAGYGMQEINDEKVIAKQKELQKNINILRTELTDVLNAKSLEEDKLSKLIKQEAAIRRKSTIENGIRTLPVDDEQDFIEIGKKIRHCSAVIKKIILPYQKKYNRWQKLERKWMRLQGKEKVYKADVELDQIMTSFRVSLVNLCSFFTREFLGELSISLSHLTQKIFLLPGIIEETDFEKKITIQHDNKNVEFMKKIQSAMDKLNSHKIKNSKRKVISFELGQIESYLK